MFQGKVPVVMEDGRFVFCPPVPTLQDLASTPIAVRIWLNYIARNKNRNLDNATTDVLCETFNLVENYESESDELVECLQAPKPIVSIIKGCLQSVRLNMQVFLEEYVSRSFEVRLKDYDLENFDENWLVWRGNCEINAKETALKMISAVELSGVQKFIVMCTYCLEDKIKTISLGSLPSYCNDRITFDSHFLIFYWICYLKDDFSGIPVEDFTSVDAVMANKCNYREKYAFEYFWNRLGAVDQVQVAVSQITNEPRFQYGLMSTMSASQQAVLFTQIPHIVLKNLCLCLEALDVVFLAWTRVRDNISDEQFAELILGIFSRWICCDERMKALINVWNAASERLRNYVVQTRASDMIDAIVRDNLNETSDHVVNVLQKEWNKITGMSIHSAYSFEFLHDFLSLMNADSRAELVLRKRQIFGIHVNSLGAMIEIEGLCFPTEEEKIHFKKAVACSEWFSRHCVHLMQGAEYEILSYKLAHYLPDIVVIRK